MKRLAPWALLACLVACTEDDTPRSRLGTIDGRAWFIGPIEGAPVTVHLSDAAGTDLGRVAEGTTEADGRFYFDGLDQESHYRVRVDLSGLAWATSQAAGAFASGVYLETTTGLIEPYAREESRRVRQVSATPITTLVMAIGEARRSVNRESPLPEALLDAQVWLGFDPHLTAIGPRDGAVDDSVRHTLLLDAFDALANHISKTVGIQAGTTFNPPDLLRILLDDARGLDPAGLFDGRGTDGPLVIEEGARNYAVTEDVLQAALSEVVVQLTDEEVNPTSPWIRLTGRDVSDLISRLACSRSDLFPSACKDERTDGTPPQLTTVDPEVTEELSGERTLTLRYHDDESPIAQVTLERLDGPDGQVVRAYEAEPLGQDSFSFQIDTREVVGESTLYLQTRAINDAGLVSARYPLQYAIRNVGPGILEGVVFKGPARNVEVQVEGIVQGAWRELGRARTNENGRFNLPLTEYTGPLKLVARGVEEGDGSFFDDEARGEPVRWGAAQTLSARVPHYAPDQPRSVTLSPLADLAAALAEAKSRLDGVDEPTAHRRSVEALAKHFSFDDPDALLHAQPVPPGEDARGISDSVRFTLALACLSEQARGLGCAAFDCSTEDVSDRFTALHLIEMYRRDAQDGDLDGADDAGPIQYRFPGGEVALPADPLRHALATACARWLNSDLNGTGESLASYIGELQAISVNTDAWLFDPERTPEPFDRAGPAVHVELHTLPDVGESLVSGNALAMENENQQLPDGATPPAAAGRVRLRFVAEDDAGVATQGVGGPPDIQVEIRADLPQSPLLFHAIQSPLGVQTRRFIEATLDLDRLPADLEGRDLRFEVTARDLLQQPVTRTFRLTVDRLPPELHLTLPANFRPGGNDRWHTRSRAEEPVGLRISAAGPVAYSIDFAGENLLMGEGDNVDIERTLVLEARLEGGHTLQATAIDRLARRAVVTRTVVIDRTPPRATLIADASRDETRAFTERLPDGSYRITLPDDATFHGWAPGVDEVVPYRKIQTRLGPVDENVPFLRFLVEDQPGETCRNPDQCPTSLPSELLAHRPDGRPLLVVDELGTLRGVQLTFETLDLDPLDPPEANTLWRLRFHLEDLAGNIAEVDGPELGLDILPPPPHIERLEAQNGLHIDDLTFANLGDAVRTGTPLVVGRYRITNPWPVPVSYYIPQPDDLIMALTTRVRPLRMADIYGVPAEPGPLDPPAPWRIEPACLAPRGIPDPLLQATALAQGQADGTLLIRTQACEGKRDYQPWAPEVGIPVAVGEVTNGVLGRQTNSWLRLEPQPHDDSSKVLEAQAQLDQAPAPDGGPGLQALVARGLGDWRYAVALDPSARLFWHPIPGCDRSPMALGCREHGWWYSQRVRALSRVSTAIEPVIVQFATSCDNPACSRRVASSAALSPALQAELSEVNP